MSRFEARRVQGIVQSDIRTMSRRCLELGGVNLGQGICDQPTPGPVNYIMESTEPPMAVDAMIKTMKRGLLISRFWYVRVVDPRTLVLTGLTRDGLWWIENGQIKNPVRNLRFNQSVLGMLAPGNVEAVGRPQRNAPYMVPPLRLGAFTFTSISDAI